MGTDKETTTQGENRFLQFNTIHEISKCLWHISATWRGRSSSNLNILLLVVPLQVLMVCLSAAPSTRRTVVISPSGGVSSRSRTAARRLSPSLRTPMSSPDTPASARWCVWPHSLQKWLLVAFEFLISNQHFCTVTERPGAYCWARDPAWWRPWPAALPVCHRKGWYIIFWHCLQ